MEAEEFIDTATKPDQWLEKSRVLRRSADVLWDTFVAAWIDQGKVARSGGEPLLDEAVNFLMVAQMLYGLALETAMKGKLLEVQPSAIQLQLTTDGTGAVQSIQIKQFGVSMGDGHNLEKLAELIDLLKKDDNRVEREILRYLSECVLWRVRYPVPKDSRSLRRMPTGVPPRAFGHYIRDWIDPWLDELLGTQPVDDGTIETSAQG
jgi:hypothetical protein